MNQRLDQIYNSEDPFLVEIFKGLKLDASLKFHKRQFRQLLETTTNKKWEDKKAKKLEVNSKKDEEEEKEEEVEESEKNEESK